jgi:hypothetical protein
MAGELKRFAEYWDEVLAGWETLRKLGYRGGDEGEPAKVEKWAPAAPASKTPDVPVDRERRRRELNAVRPPDHYLGEEPQPWRNRIMPDGSILPPSSSPYYWGPV